MTNCKISLKTKHFASPPQLHSPTTNSVYKLLGPINLGNLHYENSNTINSSHGMEWNDELIREGGPTTAAWS